MTEQKIEHEADPQQTEAVADEIAQLRKPELAEPLEDLVKFLSQTKQVFLLGAGCSKCANLPLMGELTKAVLSKIPEDKQEHRILQGLINCFEGAKASNIEDYMSELVDLISIAERRKYRQAKVNVITIGSNNYTVEDLHKALTVIKQKIEESLLERKPFIGHHRQFIRAVHGRLQSGKTGATHSVEYYTLNYDTLLEDALSLEKIPHADGFNGGTTGWWNEKAYADPKVHAKLYKMHGSIDWCLYDDDILPRRIRHSLRDLGKHEPVLIWPAATKYRETQRDPYAQILNILRKTLRPLENKEVVLTIIGYSFNDSHINDELDRALKESDGRLNMLIFTSDDKPCGIVGEWLENPILRGRLRIHTNRGFYHDSTRIESGTDLPWWKFEIIVRIMGGER